MKSSLMKSMLGFWPVSDRIMLLRIIAKPFNICFLQAYAPTADHADEEIEVFYEELERVMKKTKSDEVLIIMGDMNAKVLTSMMVW